MRPVQTMLAVATLAWLVALGTSCERQPARTEAHPPTLEDYREHLGGLEALLQEGSTFFFSAGGPNLQEYQTIVAKYRQKGLEGLTTEERRGLLFVAQFAFLTYAHTLRYSVISERSTPGTDGAHGGEASLEEVYRQDVMMPFVAARRVTGQSVVWPWTIEPDEDPQAAVQRVELYEVDLGEEKTPELGALISWEKHGATWTCSTTTAGGEVWQTWEMNYLFLFADYARGELVGPDALEGQSVYRFKSRTPPRYTDITYWLDADTLWLRQYEYERDGIHYTVKLEAINEDITIEPPDVDVPCVEETPSGEETPAP